MDLLKGLLGFVFLAGLLGVLYPFWPFRRRSRALGAILAALFGIAYVAPLPSDSSTPDHPAVAAKAACPPEAEPASRTLRITGRNVNIRTGPGVNFERTVIPKASAIAQKPVYATLSAPTKLLEECRMEGWSRISLMERLEGSEAYKGWVAHSFLKELPGPNEDAFVDADLYWDHETRPHRTMILRAVNKIAREDPRCRDSLDPGTVTLSSQSTPAVPVFFVMCGQGAGGVVNVFFKASDLAPGKTFSAPVHIGSAQAVALCEQRAKAAATHPQTVQFSRLLDLATVNHPNGNTSVLSSFTAANAFGAKLKYNIRCLFNAQGLNEAHITEAD